jgi:hypothetical protein
MSTTHHLTDMIQSAAIKMGTLAIYKPSPIVTSGTTTIITDSTLALTADELIRGTAIVTRDAGGAGDAPEGEMQSISDNAATTVTVGTAFTISPAAGDEIMIIRPKYPLVEWRRAANVVLKSFGDIPLWDTSLTVLEDTTEYTLPASILVPLEIYMNENAETGDYQWKRISEWTVQNAVPGTARTLWLPERELVTGRTIGIVYNGAHPAVYAYNDHIDVPIELASGKLAWYMINRGGITDKNRSQAEKILAELNDANKNLKIPNKRGKRPQFLSWSRN